MPVQKKEEITMDTVPKRRQRVLPKCTKFVPEDRSNFILAVVKHLIRNIRSSILMELVL